MRTALAAMGLCLTTVAAAAAPPFSHAGLDRVLDTYVDDVGRVDYAGLRAQRSALDAYVDSLAAVSPRSAADRFATPAHELAYWINAYNAFVLRGVVDAYPVASVKDIAWLNGFFRRLRFTAGGEALTLDQIENDIIRPVYREPRIHVAINCGAASCPRLARHAYLGDSLDVQLDRAMRGFAQDPRYVRLDRERGVLQLSRILDWFGKDFLTWYPQDRAVVLEHPTLVDYLMPYLPASTAADLRRNPHVELAFDDYDWALNDQATLIGLPAPMMPGDIR